ncbi:hypothetical protein NFI96_013879, partial [Prochilodus magdalenae]
EHIRLKKEGTEQIRKVSEVLVYPLYNHSTTDNDLALLRLDGNIALGPYVVPICLPPVKGTFDRTLGAVRMSVVSGWGRLAQSGPPSIELQRLEVPRVPLEKCRAHSGLRVTNSMLCAGFKEGMRDACQGDSGGPLVTLYNKTWFLTGVQKEANGVLTRTKRANSGWFEELKMGNLERECLEEKCSYEEAREVFEHTEVTNEFWKNYNAKDYCQSNPCENNGVCSQLKESYACLCPPGFSGRNCERVLKDIPDSCLHNNGGCEHFCVEDKEQRNCYCADGYFLGADGQSCLTQETFPCGKVPLLQKNITSGKVLEQDPRSRIVGGAECPRGHCPWQVLLKYGDKGFCGGAIIKPTWIITASHCLEKLLVKFLKIVAGEHDVEVNEGSEQTIEVAEIIMHPDYISATADSDIGLLRLRRPIVYSTMKTRTLLVLLACFCHRISGTLFLRKANANAVLQRPRRANSGFLEETRAGNLERECVEEICNYEEAREVFENEEKTVGEHQKRRVFWLTYSAREPCLTNPCKNNGMCIYLADSYICQCVEGFEGRYCQKDFGDTLKCLYLNGGCEQFCDGSGPRHKCACASGYSLGEDRKSCIAQVQYPCGKAPLQMNQTVLPQAVSGNQCPKGHCPWQVLLDYRGERLCGGVLVDASWVITAAHCVDKRDINYLKVIAGAHNVDIMDGTEQVFPVTHVIVHESYDPVSMDSDLALLRLQTPATLSAYTVPVCLPTLQFADMELAAVRFHTVSGWGRLTDGGNVQSSQLPKELKSPILRKLEVPLLPNPQCFLKSGVNITDNMLCAGYFEGRQESCRGNDGSPLVTQYGDTTFLTGIVSWGKGCAHPGFYRIYTKVSNFLDWIQQTMTMPVTQLDTLSKTANASFSTASPLEHVLPLPLFTLSFRSLLPFISQVIDLLCLSSRIHSCFTETYLTIKTCHVLGFGEPLLSIFLQNKDASQVFLRHRRANSMFEELKKGNMERECIEERCNYEEAREIFEDKQKTAYGNACASKPCLNEGVCKDGIGKYICFCPEQYQGYNCEIVIPQLCEIKNGGCEHFCSVVHESAKCSCAKGYKLASDRKSCISDDPFRCGQVHSKMTRSILNHFVVENTTKTGNSSGHASVMNTSTKNVSKPITTNTNHTQTDPDSLLGFDFEQIAPVEEVAVLPEVAGDIRIVNGQDCLPGDCPWQALLVNEVKIGFCGGTILNQYFILSAAHCMNQTRSITVILGEFDTLVREGREMTHEVDQVLVHKDYVPETYHNDIALIKLVKPITFTEYILPACLPERDFAERVLMQNDRDGMVSGFGRLYEGGPQSTVLQKLTVPFVDRAVCMESTKFKISNRMFCAGYDRETKDACQGDSGGPHVTKYQNTWFVTGVVSWGEGCARKGKYGVYTQVSKYIKWIESVMDRILTKKSRKRREVLGYTPVIRM